MPIPNASAPGGPWVRSIVLALLSLLCASTAAAREEPKGAPPAAPDTSSNAAPVDNESDSDGTNENNDNNSKDKRAKRKATDDSRDLLIAGGAAYGAGAASMGSLLLLQLAMSAGSLAGVFLPGLGAVLPPLTILLNLMSFVLCCGLPALEGAAIAATGDFFIGSDPGLAYLWTIAASYGTCWGGGCILGLAQLGLGALLIGPTTYALSQVNVNGVPLATLTPAQTGLAAAILVSTTAAFVAAQPVIPAAVWYLSAETPSADVYLPNLPRNRRVELGAPAGHVTTVAMAF